MPNNASGMYREGVPVEGCIEGDNEGNIQDCHQDDHIPDLRHHIKGDFF